MTTYYDKLKQLDHRNLWHPFTQMQEWLGEESRAMSACERLLERGVFAQGIRPPTVPAGTSRLRVSLSAAHTPGQVAALVSALWEVLAHDAAR